MTADLSRQTREAQDWSDLRKWSRVPHAYLGYSQRQAEVASLIAERDALAARVDALTEALRDARKDLVAIHHEGFDSSRRLLTEGAVDRIDAVLASAVPAEGENA